MLVLFFYLFWHFNGMLSMTCLAQKVPSLYVFGDSIVENGRNTHYQTGMKGGYPPYAEECMTQDNYRFTNGRTIPEIMAMSFNIAPPVSLDEAKRNPESGINYASASAGILPETGSALGKNYFMEKQISLFKETVGSSLQPKFQSNETLTDYLSSSIYLINIGSSDYIHNYLQPEHYNSSRQYNGEEFAELLIRKLENNLKDLYNTGARRMVIFQIGPLGCLPYMINKFKPRSRCAEDVNQLVSIFNKKLNVMLKDLSDKLENSTLVTTRIFELIKNMINKPSDYGFEDTRWPCCPTQKNGTGLCEERKVLVLSEAEAANRKPNPFERIYFLRLFYCDEDRFPSERSTTGIGKERESLCLDRRFYLFYDELHMTEKAYKIIVNECLVSSGGICFPSNILSSLVNANN